MSADEARNRSLQPLCRIVSWAQAGVDPAFMGMGPVDATRKAVSCVIRKLKLTVLSNWLIGWFVYRNSIYDSVK